MDKSRRAQTNFAQAMIRLAPFLRRATADILMARSGVLEALKEALMADKGRANWTFSIAAYQVLAGARRQLRHHERRMAWWEKERAKAEKRVKLTTRKVPVTSGYRDELRVEGDALSRVHEARAKIADHKALASECRRWISALERDQRTPKGERYERLHLTMDDLVFFGLVA